MTFDFSRTVSQTNTFEHQFGFSVGVEVSVEAKIPFVGEAGVTVSAETSQSWTYGSENTEETTFSTSTPLVVPSKRVYQATA